MTNFFDLITNYQTPTDLLLESNRSIGEIPLKNELVLYSKFDQETGGLYLQKDYVLWNETWGSSNLVQNQPGPFSMPNSSYQYNDSSSNVLTFYSLVPKVDLSSFSLSFYLRAIGNETFGIYQDENGINSRLRFSLLAVGTNMELHTHNSSSFSSNQTVSSFIFSNLLKPNEWTFIGLVYNSTSQLLQLYDQSGNVVEMRTNVTIDPIPTRYIDVGDSYRYGVQHLFSPSSAIACLSLHDVALTQMDMALLPCACQFKDRKLPLFLF